MVSINTLFSDKTFVKINLNNGTQIDQLESADAFWSNSINILPIEMLFGCSKQPAMSYENLHEEKIYDYAQIKTVYLEMGNTEVIYWD